jgi:hypothetical protein
VTSKKKDLVPIRKTNDPRGAAANSKRCKRCGWLAYIFVGGVCFGCHSIEKADNEKKGIIDVDD